MSDDEIISALGHDLLRELNAVCFFCDAGEDGKLPLISPQHRALWADGGDCRPLADLGCVALLARGRCESTQSSLPAVRMTQTGRRVLRRAAALQIDMEA